jgi:hypothetical protein
LQQVFDALSKIPGLKLVYEFFYSCMWFRDIGFLKLGRYIVGVATEGKHRNQRHTITIDDLDNFLISMEVLGTVSNIVVLNKKWVAFKHVHIDKRECYRFVNLETKKDLEYFIAHRHDQSTGRTIKSFGSILETWC